MFVRHVQCRWLTLVPYIQRILRNCLSIKNKILTPEQTYKQAKEREKELVKKQQERKKKLNEKENDVKLQEKSLSEDLKKANELMDEAHGRLAAAIKAKDFKN
ncbi:hypothetical protein DPMN_042995 [Dreissena polymorpha]|uniref:Uncharacterized protein n=1 Tax=Dreissena polymorpha TaxID=45954 RepID=A0A9D4HXH7_DREPO|nr:hypothetical protein DPMN_042995 [Dreissena polymorpha]